MPVPGPPECFRSLGSEIPDAGWTSKPTQLPLHPRPRRDQVPTQGETPCLMIPPSKKSALQIQCLHNFSHALCKSLDVEKTQANPLVAHFGAAKPSSHLRVAIP